MAHFHCVVSGLMIILNSGHETQPAVKTGLDSNQSLSQVGTAPHCWMPICKVVVH